MTASSSKLHPPKGGSFLAKIGEVMFSGIPTGAFGSHYPPTERQRVKIFMSVLGLEKLRERISSFGLVPLGCLFVIIVFVVVFVFVSKVVKDWSGPVRLTTDDDSGPPTTTCSKTKIFTAECRFLSTVLPPVPICGLLPPSIQSAPGLTSVCTVSPKPWVPPSRLRAPDQPPPPVSPLCLLPFHFLSPMPP